MASLEIVNGPMTIYWAPVGEAFPLVDAAPAGNWVVLGTSGDKNYHEDGVIVQMDQTLEYFTPLGSTIAKCAFRTSQEISVLVTMVDMSLDEVRVAMNQNVVTIDAGPPPTKTLDLDYGTAVDDIALLVRGDAKSPEVAAGGVQFEFNRVVEQASHALAYVKGEPVGLEMEFRGLLDDSNLLGNYVAETA